MTTVQLGDQTSVAALKRLLAAPKAKAIRVLASCGCRLRASGAKVIAASANLAGLLELDVSDSKLDDAAVVALAGSPHLKGLTRLDVRTNVVGLGMVGLRAILEPGAFPNLRSLAINIDAMARGGLELLVRSDLAGQLDTLLLDMAGLTDRHAELLAKSPNLARLAKLSVAVNEITPKGAVALGKWRSPVLVDLDLGHNMIGPKGVAGLTKLARIQRLSVRACDIGTEGVTAIARAFPNLVSLDLSANDLDASNIGALATGLPKLRTLNLDWNVLEADAAAILGKRAGLETLILSDPQQDDPLPGLRDAGAIELANSKALASLRTLNLSQNLIGDAGALAIAKSPHLRKLERLELRWNCLTPVGVRAIAARFGKRAATQHQRAAEPEVEVDVDDEVEPARPRKKPDRAKTLARLAKRRNFSPWRETFDRAIVDAAETIVRDTIAALQREKRPTRANDRRILKTFIAKFDRLDAADHFVGTIEVEDISDVFEAIREATLVDAPADDELFDTREF